MKYSSHMLNEVVHFTQGKNILLAFQMSKMVTILYVCLFQLKFFYVILFLSVKCP